MHFTHSFKKNFALILLFIGVFAFVQIVQAGGITGGIHQGQQGQITGGQQQYGNPQLNPNTCGATPANVHGQLWSSNIGWVYLNCADAPGIGGPNFGVEQSTTGQWTGYAWSPSVGYIQFGNVGCPSHQGWNVTPAAGATGCDVQLLANNDLVGWARATTEIGADSNGSCASGITPTSTDPSDDGCFDGYISMSGLNDQNPHAAGLQTTSDYIVKLGTPSGGVQTILNSDPTAVSAFKQNPGFAWGGDVIGWLKFYNAYVNTSTSSIIPTITLNATPNLNLPSTTTTTTLDYSITNVAPSLASYFTGANCTASSSPDVGSTWDAATTNITNFSSASTSFDITVGHAVAVPSNSSSTVYTISCPVQVPGQQASTAIGSVTVTRAAAPQVTLSTDNNDLCEAGSANGTNSAKLSWVGPSNASYCVLTSDGTPGLTQYPGNINSAYTGTFSAPTSSNPYITPSSPGDHHDYTVACYDSGNNQLAISNDVYVGVAPSDFAGPTPINCTESTWGISIASGSNTIICSQSNPATISWAPTGSVPVQYTSVGGHAELERGPTTIGNSNGTYTPVAAYSTSDSASITTPGWYRIAYEDVNNVDASKYGGPIYIAQSQSTNGTCDTFSGLVSDGPYCPTDSVNTAAILPKTYSWSSNADSGTSPCILDNSASEPANGSVTVTTPASHSLICTWSDGTETASSATYGPMDTASSTFCSTPPNTLGTPIIKEQ